MATKYSPPKDLEWGWTPTGEFFINVILMVNVGGKQGRVVVDSFILTRDEATALKKKLTGVQVASVIPGNGKVEV